MDTIDVYLDIYAPCTQIPFPPVYMPISSKVNLAYLARSANSLRNACVVSRNAASDSLTLIRSVTIGRPSLRDSRPEL